MTRVAIVGTGPLGDLIAYTLATRDRVREIRLINPTGHRSGAGATLDIQQAGPIERFDATVVFAESLQAVIGVNLIVLADVDPRLTSDDDQPSAVLARLNQLNPHAPIVCACEDHGLLMEHAVRKDAIPRSRLIGSAPLALQSALRALVAVTLRCSAIDVSLGILGRLPDPYVVPWSRVTVGGTPLSSLLTGVEMAQLRTRARQVWPLGPYTLASAAARIVESVLHGTGHYGVSCLAVLDGELGIRDRAAAMPVVLGAAGITRVLEPAVSAAERVQLETALHD